MHQVAYCVCPIRKCPNFSPDLFGWGKSILLTAPQPLWYLLVLLLSVYPQFVFQDY